MSISQPKDKKDTKASSTEKGKVVKVDDKVYTYCYILSTMEQRKALDLTKRHKVKLEQVIKTFFTTRLVSITILKDRYILKLREYYELGDKRRLGRLISQECDLASYVHKVKYNNAQDTSGQLFRICKKKEELSGPGRDK